MRSTHTFALLELSPAAFDEIARKLRDAQYDHAFVDEGVIDMHGIGVAREVAIPAAAKCHCFGPGHEMGCPTLFEECNPNCTCYFPNGEVNPRPCAVHSMRMEDR